MVTRHDMDKEATQRRIVTRLEGIAETLEEIGQALIQLALVATEKGINDGYLDRGLPTAEEVEKVKERIREGSA